MQTSKPMMPVRDIEWHGHRLRRGQRIVAMLAAANVDPSQFHQPTIFNIARRPNLHIAFGAGPHVCLGWKLAVAEGEIAIEHLFRRFPGVTLAIDPAQAAWSRQLGTRGMESLPVRLW